MAEGMPSRGLAHPRAREGGGARKIQVPRSGTQEIVGGAGMEQSGMEFPGRAYPSAINKKESDLSQLDFLVTLFFIYSLWRRIGNER